MSRTQLLSVLFSASVLVSIAACSGGGGGGGGGGGDDDDTPPPTPARPGWVGIRFKTPAVDQVMSVRILDGTTTLEDLALPVGAKSLVGFTDPSASAGDEKLIVMVKVALTSTAGDLYVADVTGANEQLIATGVSEVFDWADPTHLIVQKGKGPDQAFPPVRDLYVVPVTSPFGEVALATDSADEEFGAVANGKVIFRRGLLTGEANLWTVDALGGTPSALTTDVSDPGAEIFFGVTPSNRVVYSGGSATNFDLFSIPLAGGTRTTLADGASPEIPYRIVGERVIFVENVQPDPDFIEGNVRSVNADGSSLQDLSATPDVPENPVGVTPGGVVLITKQTSFGDPNATPPEPPIIDLIGVPITGGTESALGSVVGGGVDAIVGERIVKHMTDDGSAFGTITAIDVGGSNQDTLATNAVFRGATSSRVIYGTMEGADEKLFSVSVNGGNGVKLRDEAGTDTFKGSAGNVLVLSVPGVGGVEDLVAVDSNGGNLRTLAGDADAEQFRALMPDGRVIFSRRRGAFLDDIYVVNHDGTGEIGLTERSDNDVYVGHLP